MNALIILAFLAISLTLGPLLLKWAWSVALVPLFGLPEITFWQAFALAILISFLTGGFKATVNRKS